MEIKTKLSIGEDIFVIWKNVESIKEVCKICNGERYIFLKDERYECPECYGDGFKIQNKSRRWMVAKTDYTPKKNKVKRIDIEVTNSELKIAYFPWGTSGNFFYEEDCFKTLKEAEEECDKRNNNLKED